MTAPRKGWKAAYDAMVKKHAKALSAKERAERDLRHMTNLHDWRAKGERDQIEQVRLVREEMDGIAKERDALKAEIIGLKDAERTFHRDAMREEQRARKAESDLARLAKRYLAFWDAAPNCKPREWPMKVWEEFNGLGDDARKALSASGPKRGKPTEKSVRDLTTPAAPKCEHCAAGDHRTCWERKAGCCCSGGGRE